MKIIFYREKCIGCGSCAGHAPDIWRLSDGDGKACLMEAKKIKNFFTREVKFEDIDAVKKAAKDCPVNIIKIS